MFWNANKWNTEHSQILNTIECEFYIFLALIFKHQITTDVQQKIDEIYNLLFMYIHFLVSNSEKKKRRKIPS